MRKSTLLFAAVAAVSPLFAQQAIVNDNAALEAKIEKIWQDSKAVFHSPKTDLFYTRKVVDVPSPEDIAAQTAEEKRQDELARRRFWH